MLKGAESQRHLGCPQNFLPRDQRAEDPLGAVGVRRAGGGPVGSSLPQPLRETLQPLAPAHDYARGRLYRGVHTRRATGHGVPPEPEPTFSGQEPKYRVRRSDGPESEGNARRRTRMFLTEVGRWNLFYFFRVLFSLTTLWPAWSPSSWSLSQSCVCRSWPLWCLQYRLSLHKGNARVSRG